MPLSFDPKRLKTLFTAMYRENEGERSGACTAWYNYLINSSLHPEDISLSVGNDLIAMNQAVITRLQAEVTSLHNENLFLRRHVDGPTLADAIKSQQVSYQWFDLEDLARRKFGTDLPTHWRRMIMRRVGATAAQMQRWERGIAPIPEEILTAIRDQPDHDPRSNGSKKPDKARAKSEQYSWPEPVLRAVVEMYMRGVGRSAIVAEATRLAGPIMNGDRINGKLDNGRPPAFLDARVRRMGERIDWPELWLIGSALFIQGGNQQRGWRTAALKELGLNFALHPPTDLNLGTSQDKIDALRRRYIEHNLNREKVQPISDLHKPILAAIAAGGRDGATRKEIKAKLGADHYRRFSELQKTLDIFDTGLKRGDQVVYALREYGKDHVRAWELAMKQFATREKAA